MPLLFAIIAVPLVLTVINVIQLFLQWQKKYVIITELFGILIGAIYLWFALGIEDIVWKMWFEEIESIYTYPPFDISRMYQLGVIAGIGFVGWGFLRLYPTEKQPPLAVVLAFAALYAVIVEFVLYMIQIWGGQTWVAVLVYPANILVIVAKLIREQVAYRMSQPVKESLHGVYGVLAWAYTLPVLGFVVLALAVGVLVLILVLFGQAPDSIVKVWTNTAEWTLSQQTPPPKVPYDGHYLCTVAANGHRRLVKPLRTGHRQGHTILVNRQLMIANAFEDLICERTPKFHRIVRAIYDRTGFPISRRITTKLRADIVYILMKPLEWLFLLFLYLLDATPETRISLQYL